MDGRKWKEKSICEWKWKQNVDKMPQTMFVFLDRGERSKQAVVAMMMMKQNPTVINSVKNYYNISSLFSVYVRMSLRVWVCLCKHCFRILNLNIFRNKFLCAQGRMKNKEKSKVCCCCFWMNKVAASSCNWRNKTNSDTKDQRYFEENTKQNNNTVRQKKHNSKKSDISIGQMQ